MVVGPQGPGKGNTPVPGLVPLRALAPLQKQIQPMAIDAQRVIDSIKARKAELRAASYMDLVPFEYRSTVRHMAEKAYPSKGEGMNFFDFTENMALEWLSKREIFDQVCRENNFTLVPSLPISDRRPTLALTENGSIVGLMEADQHGQRGIVYVRIQIREESNLPPAAQGSLKSPLARGEALSSTVFRSSHLMSLAVRKSDGGQIEALGKGDESVSMSVISMTRAFDDVGKTVWVPRKKS